MAWCLRHQAISWTQCWLIVSGVLWHSPDNKFTGSTHHIFSWNEFENHTFEIIDISPVILKQCICWTTNHSDWKTICSTFKKNLQYHSFHIAINLINSKCIDILYATGLWEFDAMWQNWPLQIDWTIAIENDMAYLFIFNKNNMLFHYPWTYICKFCINTYIYRYVFAT